MVSVSLDNWAEDLSHLVGPTQFQGYLSHKGVANFLNVPFATVQRRFRPARLTPITDLPQVVNARSYGPRCPQPTEELHLTMGHMFEKVSAVGQLADETNCLNLNIYTPPTALVADGGSDLPVFIWCHGGGFNIGDNTAQFGRADLNAPKLDSGLTSCSEQMEIT
jgi:carboxylesterase type B